jgi:hypothetical protein
VRVAVAVVDRREASVDATQRAIRFGNDANWFWFAIWFDELLEE